MALQLSFTFEAKDDADNAYTLSVYDNVMSVSDANNPAASVGIGEIRDADGRKVHWTSKGVYQLWNGLSVRSDAANAP